MFNLTGAGYIVGLGNAIGWIGGGSNGWKVYSGTSYSSNYQSFHYPSAVFIDSAGYIYVGDSSNYRICKWDSSGNAVGWIGGGSNGWKTGTAPSNYGTDYQSFKAPKAVFVDQAGCIYVTDQDNNRICKWDASGNAIGWIGGGSNGWKTGNAPSSGTDYRSFSLPVGVYVDSAGYIYVADDYNHRISKWDASGNAIGWIGGGSNGWKTGTAPSYGRDYQSFTYTRWVYLDSYGNIYVADQGNNRICKWSSSGNAIGWIGGGSNGWKTGTAPSNGSDYQSFKVPSCIFVNSVGDIFINDSNNYRV